MHHCGGAVGEKQRFLLSRVCPVVLQEESDCVKMAEDMFKEKLGIELAFERDNGGHDR